MNNRDLYAIDELEEKILSTVGDYVAKIPRPFGLLLSGGFDSGLLAAITKPDYSFRVRFPYGPRYDESRYSDAIIKHLGLRNVRDITITPELFKENFEAAVRVMGETTTHFSLVPLYTLFKTAKENLLVEGPLNILSGEGPDEYLGGYARQIIFDELKKMREIPELRNYQGFLDRMFGSRDLVWEYGEVMNYPYDKVSNYAGTDYPLQGAIGKMDMELGVIEKMEQKMANHFGVNLHYPFINDEFAEYCYRLPDDLKIRNGRTKWAFKEVGMRYLPEIMRDRQKLGGPVAPVNLFLDCLDTEGHYGKKTYLSRQQEILDAK